LPRIYGEAIPDRRESIPGDVLMIIRPDTAREAYFDTSGKRIGKPAPVEESQ
jgi:hypothetical protein